CRATQNPDNVADGPVHTPMPALPPTSRRIPATALCPACTARPRYPQSAKESYCHATLPAAAIALHRAGQTRRCGNAQDGRSDGAEATSRHPARHAEKARAHPADFHTLPNTRYDVHRLPACRADTAPEVETKGARH